MSSQSYPLTLRDAGDYIRMKKETIVFAENSANKRPNPTWISSSFEYNNLLNRGLTNGHTDCACCIIPDTPELDFTKSTQQFGSYADNTYLTNIVVSWKRTNCASTYRVFLVELQSNDTSFESDEIKGGPANFIKRTGTFPNYSYSLQYSYASDMLGVNTISWNKVYPASSRNAKIYAFVFAYGKFGNPSPTLETYYSIRYSVFDVKPLLPLNTWPILLFTNIVGTKTGSLVSTFSVKWSPLADASYYKVFLIEDGSTTYAQTQSRFSVDPQKYDSSGSLFTSNSGKIDSGIFEFDKTYSVPSISTVTAFVYGFDASNVPCPIPGKSVTFDASLGLITLDYTLSSPNNGINYYLNETEASFEDINPTLPLPHLDSKVLL